VNEQLATSRLLFLAELLETRIIPKRIEHRIKPKQRRSQRCGWAQGTSVGCANKLLQSSDCAIGISQPRRHPSEKLNRSGAIQGVFLDRDCSYGLF
jgi:hypothetical protein